ncbi:uncharacterized protein erich1 isoform 2-T2 [Pholidichthys leucotaenia]
MAQRKEVFQSKVLQKLYSATLKSEKEQSSPSTVETPTQKIQPPKRKASQKGAASEDQGKTQNAADRGRRMYTVLPPPADYSFHPDKSVTLPRLESMNSGKDPAEIISETGEEPEDAQDSEELKKVKRRRKRKRKATFHQDCSKDRATPVSGSSTGQGQAPVDEGGEHISKNRKRKLKKKRHKDKLLSMGLVPRAAALEFTYQKADGEEDSGRSAAEVSDFLRTTLEIYMSDSLMHEVELSHLSATVEGLLSSITNGSKSKTVLKQLCSLKAFVQHKETDKLEKTLKELSDNPTLSAATCSSSSERLPRRSQASWKM